MPSGADYLMLRAHADSPQQPPLLFAEDAVDLPHGGEVKLICRTVKGERERAAVRSRPTRVDTQNRSSAKETVRFCLVIGVGLLKKMVDRPLACGLVVARVVEDVR